MSPGRWDKLLWYWGWATFRLEMGDVDWASYQSLSYRDFRVRALDPALSPSEKIGFPRVFREGREKAIFSDILSKLENLRAVQKRVLDIGAGCSGLALEMVEHCLTRGHELVLMDSEEMLAQLPISNRDRVTKTAGHFPHSPAGFASEFREQFDTVLCYSVLHGTMLEMDPFLFLDAAVNLLRPGGELLIGDLPNSSKRRRFFSTAAGAEFHKKHMKTNDPPPRDESKPGEGGIDDDVLFSILRRYRSIGFETYLLPQRPELPMANRREDILIRRT